MTITSIQKSMNGKAISVIKFNIISDLIENQYEHLMWNFIIISGWKCSVEYSFRK